MHRKGSDRNQSETTQGSPHIDEDTAIGKSRKTQNSTEWRRIPADPDIGFRTAAIGIGVSQNFNTIWFEFSYDLPTISIEFHHNLTRLRLQFARHFPDFPEDFANISFAFH